MVNNYRIKVSIWIVSIEEEACHQKNNLFLFLNLIKDKAKIEEFCFLPFKIQNKKKKFSWKTDLNYSKNGFMSFNLYNSEKNVKLF